MEKCPQMLHRSRDRSVRALSAFTSRVNGNPVEVVREEDWEDDGSSVEVVREEDLEEEEEEEGPAGELEDKKKIKRAV